jgi:hypothetical protein
VQLLDQLRVDGVALFRPVQRDDDPVGQFLDAYRGHCFFPSTQV